MNDLMSTRRAAALESHDYFSNHPRWVGSANRVARHLPMPHYKSEVTLLTFPASPTVTGGPGN